MFAQRSRAVAVAKQILANATHLGITLTPMQLLKLVYVAQGWMLGKHGRVLFPESVEAWQYGPVVPSVYQAIKRYGSGPVVQIDAPDEQFTPDEIATMDFVTKNYGRASGVTLSAATHQPGSPWYQTWASAPRSSPISNDLIQNFYESIMKAPSHSAL